jgi:hypothetical protein
MSKTKSLPGAVLIGGLCAASGKSRTTPGGVAVSGGKAARVARVVRPVAPSAVLVVASELRVGPESDVRWATETLLANKLRQIPLTDAAGHVVGLLDEVDVSRFYLDASTKTPLPASS